MPVAGGEPTQITNDKEIESRPLWRSDQRIVYNVNRNDLDQINVITVGGSPVQVTRGDDNYVLIDTDGGRLYYVNSETRSDIGSVDLESLRETEVAADPAVEMWAHSSPDGRSVVYQSNSLRNPTRKIYESAVMIKSTDAQTKRLPSKGFDARWLPDSRHISVFRLSDQKEGHYEVWFIDTVTGEEKRLTDEYALLPPFALMPITRDGVLDFSPDGTRAVYLDRRRPRNVKTGSINGGNFTNLTKNENPNVQYSSPRFSRDGARIFAEGKVACDRDRQQADQYRRQQHDRQREQQVGRVEVERLAEMLEGKAAALAAKGDDRRHRQRRDEERADDSERRRGEGDPGPAISRPSRRGQAWPSRRSPKQLLQDDPLVAFDNLLEVRRQRKRAAVVGQILR